MNWLDDYKSKLRSADEAVKMIQSGDSVYYGGNAAIPWELVRELFVGEYGIITLGLRYALGIILPIVATFFFFFSIRRRRRRTTGERRSRRRRKRRRLLLFFFCCCCCSCCSWW